jgi:rod shape-determining protein MreB
MLSLFSSDLAIDLGTANTCVYARGKGIVVNEPSIVAINKVTGRVEAVGKDAKDMLGRTPGNIVAIKPMKDGVIADFEVTEKMLTYFIKKAHNRNVWVRPRIVIGVPSEITQVEKRAVKDSAYRAKASEVHLVEEAMAAAIGAGMPITEPSGNMIVDIGGGTTDIAVISLAGIVYSKAVRVAGNEMDEAIIQYVKKQYNLLIGERTAEAIKIEIGSAFPLEERMTMEIKGRHLIEGVPKTITITDEEIREALAETVNVIVDVVRVALERTPPELSADIVDRGIVLTGGGSLLKNLDKRLREETGLPVAMAEPETKVVLLDSVQKRTDVLAQFVAALGVKNASVVRDRAEDHLARNNYDVVLMRAVSSVRENVRLLRKVRHSHKDLVMLKGPAWGREVRAGEREAERLGFRLVAPEREHV